MKTRIINGLPVHEIERGVDDQLIFRTADIDWNSYDTIVMEIKGSRNLNVRALLRFSTTDGSIQIDGQRLRIPLSAQQTAGLRAGKYVYDVKRILAGKVQKVLPGTIHLTDTITRT